MKLKNTLLFFMFLWSFALYAQDWKAYPYNPSGSLVEFPLDEGRHIGEPIEWWYTTGHVTGQTSGKEYSYMLTYFYYPQSIFDGFRILNVTDHDTGTFYQDVLPVNYTHLSTTEFNIEAQVYLGALESWKNKLDGSSNPIPFEYEVYATGGSITLDVEMETLKRPLILGDDGFLNQGSVNYTYYYSQTSNAISGSLTVDGTTENIIGNGWIDRQYGDFNPLTGEKYEWFSLQLSNGMDINLWNIFTPNRTIPDNDKYRILSAYVNESTQYTTNSFEIERLQYFCTPDDVNCYSKQWRLTSTDVHDIDVTITSMHTTNEVQLPFRFFEGAITISGTIDGNPVTGVGFTELLHYYEDPDITITNPVGFYDVSLPITWDLNNPDDGRPVLYDLEYSIDNQNTFLPIVNDLSEPTYMWNNPPISEGDEVWFKITAKSIDGVLTNTIVSASASTATLKAPSFNPNGVKLYPNPVDDIMTLAFKQPLNSLQYEIIDSKGRLVLSKASKNVVVENIDTTNFSQGVYFIRVFSESIEDFIKFIKR